jgi:hypothetical protein
LNQTIDLDEIENAYEDDLDKQNTEESQQGQDENMEMSSPTMGGPPPV